MKTRRDLIEAAADQIMNEMADIVRDTLSQLLEDDDALEED